MNSTGPRAAEGPSRAAGTTGSTGAPGSMGASHAAAPGAATESSGTSSVQMREQVVAARRIQRERFTDSPTLYNAKMTHRQTRDFCRLDSAGASLLKSAMNEMGLSARAHDKILRTARTIADLDEGESIEAVHLNEAINYRMLDRQMWT